MAIYTVELKQFLDSEYLENPLLELEEEMIRVKDISDYYESQVRDKDNYSESAEYDVKYEMPDQKKESFHELIWW